MNEAFIVLVVHNWWFRWPKCGYHLFQAPTKTWFQV